MGDHEENQTWSFKVTDEVIWDCENAYSSKVILRGKRETPEKKIYRDTDLTKHSWR